VKLKKTRPCIIVSPNEMNDVLKTVIIVPITSNKKKYPSRVLITKGTIKGMVAIDQIRTIDKRRIVKEYGRITTSASVKIKDVINEMLVK
jgi:mRNA interferase MazF